MTPLLQETMALVLVAACALYLCVRRIRRRKPGCCEGGGCETLRRAQRRGSADNHTKM